MSPCSASSMAISRPICRWSAGLRGERWSASYHGTTPTFSHISAIQQRRWTPTAILSVTPATLSPANDLWGGQVSLTYKLDPGRSLYATAVRGYKAAAST